MKRVLLLFLCIFLISTNSFAEELDISQGIEEYKAGNYSNCIEVMKSVVKNDPTYALGYYYLALAYAKTGKDILAIQNYNKVINLHSDNVLIALAKQGKEKIGNTKAEVIEEQIKDIEDEYNPILSDYSKDNQEETTYEKKEENQSKTVKVLKASDYAQKNQSTQASDNVEPSNDDIVNAIKTLQKAGILNNGITPMQAGVMPMPMDSRTQQMNSMLMMMNNGNNNGMMNMMPYMNNGGNIDPQMMQMMLMNQMMPNFSDTNNNNSRY